MTCPRSQNILLAATAAVFLGASGAGAADSITRQMAFDGQDRLIVSLPSNVTYTQGAKAGVSVTGDPDLVSQVRMKDGVLGVDEPRVWQRWRNAEPRQALEVKITAPAVEEFVFNSSGSFAVENYRRDRLNIVLNGQGSGTVSGTTKAVDYVVNGSAKVDLARLSAEQARININGGGTAAVAARDQLDIRIAGSGRVQVLNSPSKINQRIYGSGEVVRSN